MARETALGDGTKTATGPQLAQHRRRSKHWAADPLNAKKSLRAAPPNKFLGIIPPLMLFPRS